MDKQREMFEAEFHLFNLRTEEEDGEIMYIDDLTQGAWLGWQAALATVKESLTVQHAPVAWAVFADNGNCRVWFREKKFADLWIANHGGAGDALTPLYMAAQRSQFVADTGIDLKGMVDAGFDANSGRMGGLEVQQDSPAARDIAEAKGISHGA